MTITVIHGSSAAENTLAANSLRNAAISAGRGALLIDFDTGGETQHLLEKIIAGDRFAMGTEADKVNWKPSPHVIVIEAAFDRLKEFDKDCPGFSKKFGPVTKVKVGE